MVFFFSASLSPVAQELRRSHQEVCRRFPRVTVRPKTLPSYAELALPGGAHAFVDDALRLKDVVAQDDHARWLGLYYLVASEDACSEEKKCVETWEVCCKPATGGDTECIYSRTTGDATTNKGNTALAELPAPNACPAGKTRVFKESEKGLKFPSADQNFNPQADNLVPYNIPKYAQQSFDAIPAGVSMGINESNPVQQYWTNGVNLCSGKGVHYGLTNFHNFGDVFGVGLYTDGAAFQPSFNKGDKQDPAPRKVGDVSDYQVRAWIMDRAAFKFLDTVKVLAEVITPDGNKDVKGSVTAEELDALQAELDAGKNPEKHFVWTAGRTSGWVKLPVAQWVGADEYGLGFTSVNVKPMEAEAGSFNAGVMYGGNSGSVMWLEVDGGVKAVSLFSGMPSTVPIHHCLKEMNAVDSIKDDPVQVCTAALLAAEAASSSTSATDDESEATESAPLSSSVHTGGKASFKKEVEEALQPKQETAATTF